MLKHSTFNLLSLAQFWQSMDRTERIVAIALCIIVLALIAALVAVLISSSKRKRTTKPTTIVEEPQRMAPLPQPVHAPNVSPSPVPAPMEGAYEKTTLIHEPSIGADEYEKTVVLSYRPSIETTFQISAAAGVTERTLPVSEDFVIGRKAKADLQIKDPSVSQRHVQLSVVDGMLHAQDLESTNGVYLNGQKLEGTHALRSGDTLRIGTIEIRVLYTPT